MHTIITKFTPEHSRAVAEFNRRIAAVNGYGEFRFPESPEGLSCFVAVEDGAVRGGFILNEQEFRVRGETRRISHYRLPLSEGIANRSYAGVGLQMLRVAISMQPLMYALGMGGMDRPLPRMLAAMGWRLQEAPFYFRVAHPQVFLRELPLLKVGAARRAFSAAARWTGAGWLGVHAVQRLRKKRQRCETALAQASQFDGSADELWDAVKDRYALVARRDAEVLNSLYPPDSSRFLRVLLRRGRRLAGWAVLLDTQMQEHKQFGNLRVGTIADCLAAPEDAAAVMACAADFLEGRGVDLVISNQTDAAWRLALEAAGFLNGPSNYVFAVSKELARLLDAPASNGAAGFEHASAGIHVNRGDGDGPIHL